MHSSGVFLHNIEDPSKSWFSKVSRYSVSYTHILLLNPSSFGGLVYTICYKVLMIYLFIHKSERERGLSIHKRGKGNFFHLHAKTRVIIWSEASDNWTSTVKWNVGIATSGLTHRTTASTSNTMFFIQTVWSSRQETLCPASWSSSQTYSDAVTQRYQKSSCGNSRGKSSTE